MERDAGHLSPLPAAGYAAAVPEDHELEFPGNGVRLATCEPRRLTVGALLHSVVKDLHADEVPPA
jgi:hypothetical protein